MSFIEYNMQIYWYSVEETNSSNKILILKYIRYMLVWLNWESIYRLMQNNLSIYWFKNLFAWNKECFLFFQILF